MASCQEDMEDQWERTLARVSREVSGRPSTPPRKGSLALLVVLIALSALILLVVGLRLLDQPV